MDSPLVVMEAKSSTSLSEHLLSKEMLPRAFYGHMLCHPLSQSHLPEGLELPLFNSKQLAGLSADDGRVTWRVVQDGFPKGRPDPQSTDGDRILQTGKKKHDTVLTRPKVSTL